MSRPRVAVGLPVYNGAKYLAEAIESVLAQSFTDFELVISDNASSDATGEICRDFAARDSRVRYVRAAQNGGAAWNFNRAFELSKSEYFKWLAHDDVIGPQYLARAVEVLDSHPEVVLCHSRTGIIDEHGELVVDEGAQDFESWKVQGISPEMERKRLQKTASRRAHERYLGVLLHSIRNHEVFGLMRRAAMQKTGLHHAYCGGEKVFLAELSLVGAFHDVPEVLSFSRWHPDRFSANASARAQHLHMDPNAQRVRLPRQVRSTAGYLQAILGSDLAWSKRLACLAAWGRFVLQAKKWGKVLGDYTRGVGQLAKLPEPSPEATRHFVKRHWTSLAGTTSKGTV